MTDYISREAAIEAIRNDIMGGLNAEFIVNKLPAAEVREVKRGRWENVEPNFMAKCSNCRRFYISRDEKYEFSYCPNCGADMREEQT